MKARGKREAQRNASPLVTKKYFEQSAESAKYHVNYSALSELHGHCARLPGATRLTLFGACPWLSYSAPLGLTTEWFEPSTQQRREAKDRNAAHKQHRPVFSKRNPAHPVAQMTAVQTNSFHYNGPKISNQQSHKADADCQCEGHHPEAGFF